MHSSRLISIVALILCLALSLHPWGPGPAAQGKTAAGGGTVTIAMPIDVDTLDLHKTVSLDTGTMFGTLVFDRLIVQTPTMDFQPGLAEKWQVAESRASTRLR